MISCENNCPALKECKNHPFKDTILNALRKAGYSNPRLCKTWGVIVDEELRDKEYGWPLLWRVLNEIDFAWGCGGTYYHQILKL